MSWAATFASLLRILLTQILDIGEFRFDRLAESLFPLVGRRNSWNHVDDEDLAGPANLLRQTPRRETAALDIVGRHVAQLDVSVDRGVHAKHRHTGVDRGLDRSDHALPVIRRHHDRARRALHHRVENRRLQRLIESLRTLGVDGDIPKSFRLRSRPTVHRDVEVVADHPLDKGDRERVLTGRSPKPERREQRESCSRVHGRPKDASATQRGIESIDRLHRTSRSISRSRQCADRGRVSTLRIHCNTPGQATSAPPRAVSADPDRRRE